MAKRYDLHTEDLDFLAIGCRIMLDQHAKDLQEWKEVPYLEKAYYMDLLGAYIAMGSPSEKWIYSLVRDTLSSAT
jgi:hypothetical protein